MLAPLASALPTTDMFIITPVLWKRLEVITRFQKAVVAPR